MYTMSGKRAVRTGWIALAVLAILGPSVALAAEEASPLGFWKTIDDETGREKSIVRIWEEGGRLYGRIEHLFRLPDEDPDPICDECKGKEKDQKIRGMTILKGLEPKDDMWTGGTILDPKNGKVYKARITVAPDGETLTMRGYIGFSLIGRSQTWHRVDALPEPPSAKEPMEEATEEAMGEPAEEAMAEPAEEAMTEPAGEEMEEPAEEAMEEPAEEAIEETAESPAPDSP